MPIVNKVNFIVATRETTVNHEEDGALQQERFEGLF